MLAHLSIQNLAVIEHLSIDFSLGLSVLTGETGAGKSILMDALGLVLGERADSQIIRDGCPTAEVSAIYDLSALIKVTEWLEAHSLASDGECIIRRTITQEGRSRAFINSHPVPLNQLRELGELLVSIHGQHRHQRLLKPEYQRLLLDEYAAHKPLLTHTQESYVQYQQLLQEKRALEALQTQDNNLEFLEYQLAELQALNIQSSELQTVEAEHKEMAGAKEWIELCNQALNTLKAESNTDAISAVYQTIHFIERLKKHTTKLDDCHDLLNQAVIQLDEATDLLESYRDNLSLDPSALQQLEQRLEKLHDIARKHRIPLEKLLDHQTKITQEIATLKNADEALAKIELKLQTAEHDYVASAKKLSLSRQKHAKLLEKQITDILKQLELTNAQYKVAFTPKSNCSPTGQDDVDFLVSLNPGLALQPLRKIASGGELSRISLAIQVITSQKMVLPTLVFDEVDAGISGKTAQTVGALLRKLANDAQILCITHLPQIASQGHHHYTVTKTQTEQTTTTTIRCLSNADKPQEIARLLGGAKITEQALNHAKEMLEEAY